MVSFEKYKIYYIFKERERESKEKGNEFEFERVSIWEVLERGFGRGNWCKYIIICGSLNDNSFKFIRLNIWFLVGGSVWEGLKVLFCWCLFVCCHVFCYYSYRF